MASKPNPQVDWKTGEVAPRPNSSDSTSETSPHFGDAAAAAAAPHSPATEVGDVDIALLSAADFVEFIETDCVLLARLEMNEDSDGKASASYFEDDMDTVREALPPEYRDFADVFSKSRAEALPPHRPYDHKIDIDDEGKVPFRPIYRLSQVEEQALKDYLDENLAKGFIRPSQSPAGAPILFAKKKDGKLRLVVDFRGINNITRKDRYPLPRIESLLDRLCRAKFFTKLDLRHGFHNVRIAEGHEWKTAFRTRYGSFEYLVLPMGLTNSPATFQHFMNDIFHDMLDDTVCGYLDDIMVFTESEDIAVHVAQVREVLSRLRKNHLFVKLEKCDFHSTTSEFLGYVVSPSGLSMSESKTEVIESWPTPDSVKDVQTFLGFANFYRRFIEGYSAITRPLNDLTKKSEQPFTWTAKAQGAFEHLKKAFTTAPILRHFYPDRPCVIETDASDYAIAAILSQPDPVSDLLHPVAYYSRSMAPAELNYEIHDKELLAIHACFKEWRCYLEGSAVPVEVVTDHKTLEYFSTSKVLTRRQARWSEFLSGFNFLVKYRPGRLGGKPDALTRRSDLYPKKGDGAFARNNPQNVQTLFKDGQLVSALRATMADHPEYLTYPCQLRAAFLDVDSLRNDIIAAITEDPIAKDAFADPSAPHAFSPLGLPLRDNRVYVPDSRDLRLRILQMCHDHPVAGHYGREKTLDLVRRDFFWPRLRDDVVDFVKSCTTCARTKVPRHKPYGLLRQLPIPVRPWDSISMDFIEVLPLCEGSDAILVIADRLTKMATFIATNKSITSQGLARLYILHVFSKHGIPSDIVSDRGSEFTSEFWRDLGKQLLMKSNLSTSYHPQTDGQTERTNQTLEAYLRAYINYQQDDWVTFLPIAEFAYNNSIHSGTTVSPFFANYGYHPRMTFALDPEHTSPESHDTAEDLSKLHSYVKEELAKSQQRYDISANRDRMEPPPFNVGDRVWLNGKNIKTKRPMRKLDYRMLGPFDITDKISSHAFRLKLPRDLERIHNVFHVDLLTLFQSNRFANRAEPPPPPIEIDEETEYEVERILDSRIFRRKLQYLVKWKGFEGTSEEATWQPAGDITNADDVVRDFHTRYPDKPRPPGFAL